MDGREARDGTQPPANRSGSPPPPRQGETAAAEGEARAAASAEAAPASGRPGSVAGTRPLEPASSATGPSTGPVPGAPPRPPRGTRPASAGSSRTATAEEAASSSGCPESAAGTRPLEPARGSGTAADEHRPAEGASSRPAEPGRRSGMAPDEHGAAQGADSRPVESVGGSGTAGRSGGSAPAAAATAAPDAAAAGDGPVPYPWRPRVAAEQAAPPAGGPGPAPAGARAETAPTGHADPAAEVMPPARPARESRVEMTELVLPNDANPLGNILGGKVMHLMDIAGALAAARHSRRVCVTASVDSIDFLHPIRVGEAIQVVAQVTDAGRTSMEVQVDVYSENLRTGQRRHTATAFFTFVALDERGQPTPVPAVIAETPEERRRQAEARRRRQARLARVGRLVEEQAEPAQGPGRTAGVPARRPASGPVGDGEAAGGGDRP